MTPEGKVKRQVTALLKQYSDLYYFMPVPSGFGESSLDYLICYRGRWISVETKRPGGKPTERQERIAASMRRAGGAVFVIDGPAGVAELKDHLDQLS